MKLKIILFFWFSGTLFFFQACSSDLPEDLHVAYDSLPETIDFNFHVQPILSDRCFSCHGPDENARKGNLRLDLEESAFAVLKATNHRAFVPKSLSKSEAFQRIISKDPTLIMPPPESHLTLSNKEKAILAKWINQGAVWKPHWSFTPPAAPEIPDITAVNWPISNEIDAFIWNDLLQNNLELSPNPPASKERLIRRVTMDLTGLPPTIDAIDAFLKDGSAKCL